MQQSPSRDPDTVRGPDLAVEIRSPSNRPGVVREKVADYLAAGTRVVWVVDPHAPGL